MCKTPIPTATVLPSLISESHREVDERSRYRNMGKGKDGNQWESGCDSTVAC